MKKALISVSNKNGLAGFAQILAALDYEIISTGGTKAYLEDSGINVTGVTELTGFPECLSGRVKTLHPKIFGGILAQRDNPRHVQQMEEYAMKYIDIVIVNLYPFKETVLKESAGIDEIIENIDIGGPSMIRAAAKNYRHVAVVTDSQDYELIITELKDTGDISLKTKEYLAAKAFMHTAHYDALIAEFFSKTFGFTSYPNTLTLTYEKVQEMRYGENPHQPAAFYRTIHKGQDTLADAEQLHGKELSFNNINDTNGALELVREFSEPTIVACKHTNPCGVGSDSTILEAYKKAYKSDPVSIFGGIVVSNRTIDTETAKEINKTFIEIILAPDYTTQAFQILTQKKNIRILRLNIGQPASVAMDIKSVCGGILVQHPDKQLFSGTLKVEELKQVTSRKPTDKELRDMLFGYKVVKHVKSNAIAIVKNGQSVGIGIGQVNRLWACQQAIAHGLEFLGKEYLEGATLASDAYFPFSDCIEEAAKAGITAIIQPGGSVRDQESISLCDKYGISMVFTGMRHFRH